MSTRQWHEEDTVYQNDTGPVLELLFLEEDGRTVRNLTGYHGWLSFWYPDAAPHVVRAGTVDGSNGILRYFPQGDEYTTVGGILIQGTVCATDLAAGTDRAFFKLSFPVLKRRVVAKT